MCIMTIRHHGITFGTSRASCYYKIILKRKKKKQRKGKYLCLRVKCKPRAHSVCTADAFIAPPPLHPTHPPAGRSQVRAQWERPEVRGHLIVHPQYIQFRSTAVGRGHRRRVTSPSCSRESQRSHSPSVCQN